MLYYIRKYLHRRVDAGDLPKIHGADLTTIDFNPEDQTPRVPLVSGTRGQILRLWRRWTREHEARGIVRSPSETAAELARRIGHEAERAASREALTRLFEQAHYGEQEPSPEYVEKMREWVKADLEKESKQTSE
jgi:hypothetical protein